MAGDAANLLDLDEQRVGVAVQAQLDDLLHVARFLALAPQALARARPVHRLAALHALRERCAVHPGHGKHLSALEILGDRGDQAVLAPANFLHKIFGRKSGLFLNTGHRRTSMPRERMCSFAWRTLKSPKWNTLAASTASAWPSSTPSAMCSAEPTPPEAITGTPTASDTARVSARSKPSRVPSRSMLVSRISPAPAASMRRAHSSASMPVPLRPPCVKTSHEEPFLLASIATTTHWQPTISDAWRTRSGFCTAAVLIDTLSAPALRSRRTSSTLRTPPPTVRGIKTREATASITCSRMSRSSELAVMSRNASSSAPSPS